MQRYEEEDSDHSVNGWIKKEIVEDDEDMEEYLKHGQDTDPGDQYENMMSLSKEELVAKVLQMEEDIRYLQDIRNGFEKSVQELSATAAQYQTLINNLLTVLSSLKQFKEQQSATVSTASDSTMPVSSTISSRSSDNARETSPRSTPSSSSNNVVATSLANPKMVPIARNNTRLTESTTQSFMTSSNVLPVKERTHITAVNTQSTVTITRSTNLIIKAEIPSPPPEPEIIENPMEMTHNVSVANYPKKRKYEAQSSFQSQQQQHPNSSTNASPVGFSPIPTTVRSAGQRAKVSMPIPQLHAQQQRPRMSASIQSGPRGPYPMQNIQAQVRQQQPVQNIRIPTPRFARNNPRMPMRGRGNVQDVSFPNPMQRAGPRVQQMTVPNSIGRPRQSTVKITPIPTTTASPSPVNNVLADLAAKMPHISLSLVQPGGGALKASDNGSRSMIIKPTEERSAAMASSTFTSSNSKSGGKVVTSNQLAASSTPSSNQTKTVNQININFGDDDDDENDYDEIAVLIPDKKNPIAEEDSDPNIKNSQPINKKQARGSELFVSQETFSANWAPQNTSIDHSNQNAAAKIYHNNDEYMFDDPLDDTDIEENDSKFYLGEDVNLPKDVVDNCIKSSSNGDQLTQKLMEALFPDLAQVATSCNIDGNKAYTILPTNKVNAIIGLVQQRFPLKTRKEILGIVNGKFHESKVGGPRNSRPVRGVQYKNY